MNKKLRVFSFLLAFCMLATCIGVSQVAVAVTDTYTVTEDFSKGVSAATLSYTKNDGTTETAPLIKSPDGFSGVNCLTWDSNKQSGNAGEIHQRLNIAKEYKGASLTEFSFKTLALSNNKATPVYILLGKNSDTTQFAFGVGGYHNENGFGFKKITDLPLKPTATVNGTTDIFMNSACSKDIIANEAGKLFLTVTVKINYETQIIDFTVYKPASAYNGEINATLQSTKRVSFADFSDVYFAISSSQAFPSSITDVSMTYTKESPDNAWVGDVSDDTAAPSYLSYTASDGVTLKDPIIETVSGKKTVVFNSSRSENKLGENHQRINIAASYDEEKYALRSFTYKTLAPDPNNNKACLQYLLFGAVSDEKQLAVPIVGYRNQSGTMYWACVASDLANIPPTSNPNLCIATNISRSQNITLSADEYFDKLAADAGKAWVTVNVEINEKYKTANITFTKGKTSNVPERSASLTVDLADVKTDYYAISTAAVGARISNVYVTDISATYERVQTPLERVNSEIANLPDFNAFDKDDYASWIELKNKLDSISTDYDGLTDAQKGQVVDYDTFLNYVDRFTPLYNVVIANYNANKKSGAIINFEDGNYDALVAVNCKDETKWGITDIPHNDAVNESSKCVKIIPNSKSSYNKSLGAYLLNTDLVNGTTDAVNTFRAKLLVTTQKTRPVMIYEYKDDSNWSGFFFDLNGGEIGIGVVRSSVDENGNTIVKHIQNFPSTVPMVKDNCKIEGDTAWIDVVIKYDVSKVSLTINTPNGLVRPYNKTMTLTMPTVTRVGFTSFSSSSTCYVDDVSVTFGKTASTIVANSYLKKYDELLRIRAVTLADTDNNTLTSAINDYNSLSQNEKNSLPLVNVQLNELQSAMTEVLGSGVTLADKVVSADYWNTNETYTITEDFEGDGSLGRFVDYNPEQFDRNGYGKTPVVRYNGQFGSKALNLYKVTLAVKQDFLPEKAQLKHISFDTMLDKNATELRSSNALRVYMWFYNSDHNAYYDIFSDLKEFADRNAARFKYIIKGANTKGGIDKPLFDMTEPMHFDFEYIGKKVMVTVTQTYFNGEENETVTYEAIYDCPYDSSFFLLSGDNNTWIDNLSATYIKGDYDIDSEVEDIKVIYSGNTFQNPGDTVVLNGENLGSNVSSVNIARIDETAVSAADMAYINTYKPDFGGVQAGTFSSEPTAPVWNSEWDSDAYKTDILQTTSDSVKFKIPLEYKQGIYAVKLFGNDFFSNEDDKVIYINAPYIDYAVGDQGENVTAGGELQVVGKNLSPNQSGEGAAVISKAVIKGNGYIGETSVKQVKSDYSFVIDIPSELTVGNTYELWVYNGYGDNTCWSIPLKFTVATDIRSGWSKTFYNFQTDFGATGAKEENVTPLLIKAMQALYESGGGTLYMPRGIYRVEQPIIIPENVVLTGDSSNDSVILYTPYRWQNGELPDFVIQVTKNVEISKMSFYGTRINGFMQVNTLKENPSDESGRSENIYISDVYVEWSPYSGGPWGVYNNVSPLIGPEKDGSIELINAINAEMIAKQMYFMSKTTDTDDLKNVQISDTTFRTFGYQHGIWTAFGPPAHCSYWQIRGYNQKSNWSSLQLDNSIVEDFNHNSSCAALWGHGLYVQNSSWSDNMQNNRELCVADKSSMAYGFVMTAVEDGGKNVTFTVPLNTSTVWLREAQIFVSLGNGAGQTRRIVSAKRIKQGLTEIVLDSPFVTPVNRNSMCVVGSVRENQYYVNNYLSNGSTGIGFYGRCIDTVLDGNTYNKVGTPYMQARNEEKCWYYSFINNQLLGGSFFNRATGGEDGSEFTYFFTFSSGYKGIRSFMFRNNDFNDYGIHIKGSSVSGGAITDFIVENNSFSDRKDAIWLDGSASYTDGVYICNNVFTDVDTPYTEQVYSGTSLMNETGSFRIVVAETERKELLGDVNLDNKVSVKDITYIRYYLIGKIELTDAQKKNADMDADGEVTLKDAILLRQYILKN